MQLLNKLKGKKTYIIATIIALINLLAAFNLINSEQLHSFNLILAALGASSLRHALNNKPH